MTDLEFHPAGDSPSDSGQSNEQLEGSIKSFGDSESLKSPTGAPEPLTAIQGPGGDSRPDDGRGAGFIDVTDSELEKFDGSRSNGEIHKEDPETLTHQRVDQEDEIVATPDQETGEEIAVLRKKTTFQPEGESSEL